MKERHTAVFFTRNNARIFPFKEMSDLPRTKNIVVNPDLSLVEGIPPHHWKLEHGKVLPMNDVEKKIRDHDIATKGIENKIEDSTPPHVPKFELIEQKILSQLNRLGWGMMVSSSFNFFLLMLIVWILRHMK